MKVFRKQPTIVAILGGNTVAGLALSLLLKDAGYEVEILKAPPSNPAEDLLADVDLLLVSPGLDEERRDESLAALRGAEGNLHLPVLAFGSAVEERLFGDETAGTTWPVEIGLLVRGIEAALGDEAEMTAESG
jgi:nucleoside-diphosphate-sugar epimerase